MLNVIYKEYKWLTIYYPCLKEEDTEWREVE